MSLQSFSVVFNHIGTFHTVEDQVWKEIWQVPWSQFLPA